LSKLYKEIHAKQGIKKGGNQVKFWVEATNPREIRNLGLCFPNVVLGNNIRFCVIFIFFNFRLYLGLIVIGPHISPCKRSIIVHFTLRVCINKANISYVGYKIFISVNILCRNLCVWVVRYFFLSLFSKKLKQLINEKLTLGCHPYTSCSWINIHWMEVSISNNVVPRYKLSLCHTYQTLFTSVYGNLVSLCVVMWPRDNEVALEQVCIVSHSYHTYFGFPRSDLNLDCGLPDHVITRFILVSIRARLWNKVVSFCSFKFFSVCIVRVLVLCVCGI